MTAWRKVFRYSLLAVLVLLLLAITLTIGWRPFVGPRARRVTDRQFEATPVRLGARRLSLNTVATCLGCHGDIDWKTPRLVPELLGAGHHFADEGLDWVVAPNLTPDHDTGVGAGATTSWRARFVKA